jgi:hypothetical protein
MVHMAQVNAFAAYRIAQLPEAERRDELTKIGVGLIGRRNFAWDGRDLDRAYRVALAGYELALAKIEAARVRLAA